MEQRNVIGIDLAKNVFEVVTHDARGKELKRKRLSRAKMHSYFSNMAPALIGMEACATSHYWGRKLRAQGHEVRLLPAQHVKAYRRGQKNDYRDAQACAEAVVRPSIRAVPIKTVAQQDLQSVQRMRQSAVDQRTAQANQIRGLLLEYGVTVNKGIERLINTLPGILEDAENGLSEVFRRCLSYRYEQLRQSSEEVKFFTHELQRQSDSDERCRLLKSVPAYGPIVSAAYVSRIGDGSEFARGRDVSAAVGLVPAQHSTGGREVLLGITKKGDKPLRYLIVHGARAVAKHAEGKTDPLSVWFCQVRDRRGYNKAVVALANKLTRIAWAVLQSGQPYDAQRLASRSAPVQSPHGSPQDQAA